MMLHLSLVKVPQTLGTFGTGDIQTTHGPLWILTDGTCENTGQWDTHVFSYYGASYQQDESERGAYPLTVQEAQFLQAEDLDLPGYATEMLMGYSAWWLNKKWLCPLLEYCYEPEDQMLKHHSLKRERGDFLSRPDSLRAFVESEAERLSVLLKPLHGEVLLDLEGFTDRYVLHLLVPYEKVLERFLSSEGWQHFLRSLFSVKQTPSLVYIDGNCEQERGGLLEVSNAVGKSYGCALYDLTQAPNFLPGDFDSLHDWVRNEAEPLLKVWGPSEEAAVHNARLACDEQNYVPVDPFSLRYLPRQTHMLHP